MTYLGLYAQQHRGQESSGIVSLNGKQHIVHRGDGLVGDVFKESDLMRLQGNAAIGHNRYSTTGANLVFNIQPLSADLLNGPVALAHNGNFVNAASLREELKGQGSIFHVTHDTGSATCSREIQDSRCGNSVSCARSEGASGTS